MGVVIAILVVIFLVGLLSRSKGDNFLDTMGSGCGTIIGIIVILIIILLIIGYNS
jgi:preprotein translocase subunit SecG